MEYLDDFGDFEEDFELMYEQGLYQYVEGWEEEYDSRAETYSHDINSF